MPEERLVTIASHLRPEEAGMLRGLLESAGIEAVVNDEALSSIHPFLQPAIGGAKLAVLEHDVERALQIMASAGVGGPPGKLHEVVEIPEEEWSRPELSPDPGPARAPVEERGPGRLVLAVVFAAMLLVLYVLR